MRAEWDEVEGRKNELAQRWAKFREVDVAAADKKAEFMKVQNRINDSAEGMIRKDIEVCTEKLEEIRLFFQDLPRKLESRGGREQSLDVEIKELSAGREEKEKILILITYYY